VLFPDATPAGPISVIAHQPKAKRPIVEVIIHCTATPEGRDVSMATIRGWHKKQGWKDIGYHYVVMLDGTVEQGRPEGQIGSHVAGHNTGTMGVVYVGGVAKDGPPQGHAHASPAGRADGNGAGSHREVPDHQEGHRPQSVCRRGMPLL
jgi:hypothetical protein